MRRNKTPAGFENLPIPPPVVCPLTKSKNNTTTTSSRPKTSSPIPSPNNPPHQAGLNYQAAMAAAAAALFNPALAPFLSANNMKTPNTSLLAPQSINSQQQATDSLNLFRNQLFNQYNPFMNQLALAASLSNTNQNTTTSTTAQATPASSTSNKIYGKS